MHESLVEALNYRLRPFASGRLAGRGDIHSYARLNATILFFSNPAACRPEHRRAADEKAACASVALAGK